MSPHGSLYGPFSLELRSGANSDTLTAYLSAGTSTSQATEDLCLACGMCCNGVLFADVKLQPGDDPGALRSLGLLLTESRAESPGHTAPRRSRGAKGFGFSQPCAALEGCRCRIYPDRPKHCRQFECLLLKSFRIGKTERAVAFQIIRTARERAERVRRLLRELGDTEESLPLSRRFQRTTSRLELIGAGGSSADDYAELTLAVHDLNFLLSDAFYPG